MHTKSLVTLKKMLVQRDERKKSRLNLPELASDTDKGSPEAEAAVEGTSGGAGELEAALQKHGLERVRRAACSHASAQNACAARLRARAPPAKRTSVCFRRERWLADCIAGCSVRARCVVFTASPGARRQPCSRGGASARAACATAQCARPQAHAGAVTRARGPRRSTYASRAAWCRST